LRRSKIGFFILQGGHLVAMKTISKLFEEHGDSGELDKTQEVGGVILATNK
jgi:hypothetical protein